MTAATARERPQRREGGPGRVHDGSRGPVATGHARGPAVQRLPRISQVDDPMEIEAGQVARSIAAGAPAGTVGRAGDEPTVAGWLHRLAAAGPAGQAVGRVDEDVEGLVARAAVGRGELPDEPVDAWVQRFAIGPAVAAPAVAALRAPGVGGPLSPSVRGPIEAGLGVGLGDVQVHTGRPAERAAAVLGARAFTHGSHVFLGAGESPHDLALMAHEATHVVQQGAHDTVYRLPALVTDTLADYARNVPGYSLFTVIAGFDPLAGERVERTALNLVGGLMGLVPFGTAVFDELVELGIIQDALAFVERELVTFDLSVARLERLAEQAWEELDLTPRPGLLDENLDVLARTFAGLLADVRGFASSVLDALLDLVKDALVGLLGVLLGESPAWALARKVMRRDPLTGDAVEATTVEILEDFLRLIGREQELDQLRERGALQRAADWIDTRVAEFGGLLGELGALFTAAWAALRPANLPDLDARLPALADQALGLLRRVWDFAATVAATALQLVKDALLGWLSAVAHEAPGFDLLTVVLGRNPFTGAAIPRTAENLIKGFLTLLPGGAESYAKLAESGVVGTAAARVEAAKAELGISWELVTGLFRGIWDSLTIDDLVDPLGAFLRIRDRFGEVIGRLVAFVRVVLRELFELILAMANFPTDLLARIVANAMQAYEDLKRDPVGFLLNMLAALKEGFSRFFAGIADHLLAGLVDWLFRGLRKAGIQPPAELTLQTGLELALKVLGLGVDVLWTKLGERIGPERVAQIRGAVDKLVGIWTFVRDIQERGVSAIWEYVGGQIANLWDTILGQVRAWILREIVDRVVVKLLSMLDPTGVMAVVNSFIAFFNAVQSAIEYLREILGIVDTYVATLAAVARGDIEPGAAMIEKGFAAAIPVAIGFLARQVGLGDIGDRIAEILAGLRAVVDRALDWLLDQAERALQAVLAALGKDDAGVDPTDHVAVARRVVQQLEKVDATGTFEAVRERIAARATALEGYWSPRLEKGIALTVSLTEIGTDRADRDIDFEVRIAPNTVTDKGSVDAGGKPSGPRKWTELDLESEDDEAAAQTSAWEHIAEERAAYVAALEEEIDPLRSRAKDLVYPRQTVAVAGKAGTRPSVAGGYPLRPAQVIRVVELDMTPEHGEDGDHGELRLFLAARDVPTWLYASNLFCPRCEEMIRAAGGELLPEPKLSKIKKHQERSRVALFGAATEVADLRAAAELRRLP